MHKVLELQKLVPDTEGKGQALDATVTTITITVGKSSISFARC